MTAGTARRPAVLLLAAGALVALRATRTPTAPAAGNAAAPAPAPAPAAAPAAAADIAAGTHGGGRR